MGGLWGRSNPTEALLQQKDLLLFDKNGSKWFLSANNLPYPFAMPYLIEAEWRIYASVI